MSDAAIKLTSVQYIFLTFSSSTLVRVGDYNTENRGGGAGEGLGGLLKVGLIYKLPRPTFCVQKYFAGPFLEP